MMEIEIDIVISDEYSGFLSPARVVLEREKTNY